MYLFLWRSSDDYEDEDVVILFFKVEAFVFGPVDSNRLQHAAIVPRMVAFSSHDSQGGTESTFHLSRPHSFVSYIKAIILILNCYRTMSVTVSSKGSISSSL